jgi:predicted nucleic-acid-binding protein
MIGLDTNILVRYLTRDDPSQTAAARELINSLTPELSGFIPLIVVAETTWVLTRSYSFTREEMVQVLETFLRGKEVVVERAELVEQALRTFVASGADFSDCLIERCCHEAECQYTVTFDKKAAAAGMRLIGG